MRCRVPAALLVAALAAACSGAGASPAGPLGRVIHQRVPARAATTVSSNGHPVMAAPGVTIQRLLPPASTVTPRCPGRTMIGTAVASSVTARTRPDSNADVVATFPRTNSQGVRQVFDLIGQTSDANGTPWYEALLPIRPNDTIGYIRGDRVHVSWTDYWLVVRPRNFQLTLYRSCSAVATYPVGIGTGSTPTPVGYFYLQSLLQPSDPNGVYGAYAYGLSGYSDVIHEWRWGGLVGLHGTNDPSGIGHLVSHGCIRMYNRDITKLVKVLPLGTPITIA